MTFQILAIVIEPSDATWLIVTIGGTLTTAAGGFWLAGKKLAIFLKPHVEGAFNSHKKLVEIATDQIPVMNATLTGVNQTLTRLSETQDSHTEILQAQGDTLDKIRARLERKKILDAESDG